MNDSDKHSFVNPEGQIQQDDSANFLCNYDKTESWNQSCPSLHLLPDQNTLHEDAASFLNTGPCLPSHMEHPSSRNLSSPTPSSSSFDQYRAYDHLQAFTNHAQREIFSSNHESSNNIHGLTSRIIASSQKIFVQPTASSDVVDQPSYCPQNRAEPVGGDYFVPPVLPKEQSNVISSQKNTVASVAVLKLWDGYLHLNSSVKLPTTAYFKSGEKMPDINWSESIEVKGKVRLEAFEKYIQELPRSRTRGLMVMSLCLKGGLPCKFGRVGIKEVASKLIEGKRVGLAQLSPGVDLYVCPQSYPIVNILAKHGFFKGAVKAKQDALIGCVVWRKTSLDPNTKKLDEKNGEQASRSSGFNTDQHAINSSSAKPTDAIHSIRTVVNGNIGSSNVQSASSSLSSGPTTTISSSFISFPLDKKQDALPLSDLNTIHGSVQQLSEIEASIFKSLGFENSGGNLELLKALLPPSLMKPQQPLHVPNSVDDLPEYDFNSAVARASVTRPTVEANKTANQNPQDEEFNRDNRSSSSSQIFFESQRNFPFERVSALQKRKAQEIENVVWSNSSQKIGSNSETLFDDDMPEWNPPDNTMALKPSPEVSVRPCVCRDQQLNVSSLSSRRDFPPLLPTPPLDRLQFPPQLLPPESSSPLTDHSTSTRAYGNSYVQVSPRYSSSVSSDRGSRAHSKPYSFKGSVHHQRTSWK